MFVLVSYLGDTPSDLFNTPDGICMKEPRSFVEVFNTFDTLVCDIEFFVFFLSDEPRRLTFLEIF